MPDKEIIGLWTLPGNEVIRAMQKAGLIFPDWWKHAEKISIRSDEHGLTFIGRRSVKDRNEKQS